MTAHDAAHITRWIRWHFTGRARHAIRRRDAGRPAGNPTMDATESNAVSSARDFSRQNLTLILQAQERVLRLLARLGIAPAPQTSLTVPEESPPASLRPA